MEYIEDLLNKYNSEVDEPILRELRKGRIHKRCGCSQCQTVAAYFFLKNGGMYDPSLLNNLHAEERKVILDYVFLRAIGSVNQ